MPFTRRCFLKSGSVALAGIGSAFVHLPSFLVRAAATGKRRSKTLIVLFQRGAADGLNIVVPHGGSRYYDLRPGIAIPRPANGADYPDRGLGKNLRQFAQLIKADVGLEIAFAEIGGWDHHVNEGGAQGQLANLLRPFAEGVGAFVRDLGDRMDDVVIVTLSEFGRTVRENGSRGTDHGHANAIFVIGGPVSGGKLYGDWPGLADDRLHEGRDLALTTDFRDVISEALDRHLGATELERVFPGYAVDSRRYRGLF